MKLITKIFLPALIGVILLSLLHTHGKFLLSEYLIYYLWFIPSILIIEIIRRHKGDVSINYLEHLPGIILCLFLLAALSSSFLHHKWFYFLEWRRTGIIRFILLTQLFIPLLFFFKNRLSLFLFIILFSFQLLCLAAFLETTGGNIIYEDDHASVMYRIWEISRTFPQLTNYSPYWNGGVVTTSGTTTGAVSLGILFWPLWRSFDIGYLYTYILPILFIFIIPFLIAFSLRLISRDWTASWIAGLFSIGVSQYYFLWLLHYGTPSAELSSALIVPFACILYRIVWEDKIEWWTGLLLIITALFLVLWPLGVLLALAAVSPIILNLRRINLRKTLFLGVCFLVFCGLYFKMFLVTTKPQTLGLVSSKSNLCDILRLKTLCNGWHYLGALIKEGHPLLIFLGIGGVFFIPSRNIRIWFIPITICLAVISGWGRDFAPKLELNRIAIPLFFISIVPASIWISNLLKIKTIRYTFIQATLTSLLILGGWNCVRIYKNDSLVRYKAIPNEIKELVNWLKTNTPEDGRILFGGSTMHGYGHSHVAFMPYLVKREMLASDYFHYSPRIMQPHFPPQEFLNNKDDTFRYMEFYNVTHIITQEEKWENLFHAMPEQYKKETTISGKTIFSVNREPTMFLKGSGEIEKDFNQIKILAENEQEEIVIKYNWQDGLEARKPAEIFPFDTGTSIKLIGIRPNGEKDIVIRYKNWL